MNPIITKLASIVVGGGILVGGMNVITFDNGQTALQNVMTKVTSLSTNVNDLQGQKSTLLGSIGTKNDKITELDTQIKGCQDKITELTNKGNADKTLIDELNAQLTQLQTLKTTLEGEKAELQSQLDDLNLQLADEKAKNVSLTEAFTQQKAETQKAIDEINKLSSDIDNVTVNGDVTALPDLDTVSSGGTTPQEPTTPPTTPEEPVTPPVVAENVWDLNKVSTFTYNNVTVTREVTSGTIYFTATHSDSTVESVKLNYKDSTGTTKTVTLTNGVKTTITNPPHTYTSIVIAHKNFAPSKTIDFINIAQ